MNKKSGGGERAIMSLKLPEKHGARTRDIQGRMTRSASSLQDPPKTVLFQPIFNLLNKCRNVAHEFSTFSPNVVLMHELMEACIPL